jgi:hypothetical protein
MKNKYIMFSQIETEVDNVFKVADTDGQGIIYQKECVQHQSVVRYKFRRQY